MNLFRLKRYWTVCSLTILLLAGGWTAFTSLQPAETTNGRTPAPQPGFLAPDFTLQTLDGKTIRLSEAQGSPVILNIWASWCPPCQVEMPAIEKVYQEFQPKGLQVLALNTAYQDSLANTQAFVEDHALTFPILLDTDGKASAKYQVNALPSTYFIDRDGIIQAVIIGGPISEAVLRANILELLNEAR